MASRHEPMMLNDDTRCRCDRAAASRLTLDIPEDVLFRWCGVKGVESNRAHAVLLHHLLGVEPVVFGLAHLLP